MNRIISYFLVLSLLPVCWGSRADNFSRDSLQVTAFMKDSVCVLQRDSTGAVVLPDGYALKDSVVYVPVPRADTLLAGKNIYNELPSKAKGDAADVLVHQSESIRTSMNAHFAGNASRNIGGYRIRIFFDNRQSAREDSEEIMRRFMLRYPDVQAYRSYVNPYFKVTVGDFRSKSEAMQLLRRIREEFPAAFIVKEKSICYPVADKSNAVRQDTVKVLYRLPEQVVL